jgi:hypothetical protein
LPDAEHISAVISSREATISKFNRMGLKAGFGSPRVRMVRVGTRYVHDPNRAEPEKFAVEVHDPNYHENWIDGLEVHHNPNASIPLDPNMLWGATHHSLLPDGRIKSLSRHGQPFGTVTVVSLEGAAGKIALEAELELHEKVRLRAYELYEKKGKQHGHDLDDWLKAEAELISETAGSASNG